MEKKPRKRASTLTRTHYLAPQFPEAARARGIEGWVDLQFLVNTDGSVGELTTAPYVVASGSGLSPSSAFRAMAISVSPSPRFINRTPFV